MRIMLFYDLAMTEIDDLKAYTKFHKWIVSRGYIMIQYSLYIKSINAATKLNYELNAISRVLPKHGNIRLLTITETQYQNIKILRGCQTINEKINQNERYVRIDENL